MSSSVDSSTLKKGVIWMPHKNLKLLQNANIFFLNSQQLLTTYYGDVRVFMVWKYGIYPESWSFLVSGAGKWLQSEQDQISVEKDNIC